ncbi:tyrosine-protein phosphatase (plasmid) [Arthrobacter sp. FW306-05-C]|uniref:tyrosine-protein phosphatase n=1 Tax=unclassified Arthrobacter TaxID=235627 RepID=UPI001EF12BBB|nr:MULTISPECIES: tyrosine-protein phosphatase [unclassified Arthrobacter]UKA69004.1 tyrosine-protein phosphatase [Arthrobacter sp. FW306-05-C]UKA73412.1 tyrosine-protein phosphatase [Arthrobacter sp. FW306-06-A]
MTITSEDAILDTANQPLAVEGTYNFRSAGGYAASGRTVREGKLFRSDGLHQLTDAGRAHLAELGIRRVIDLRDRTELEQSPSRLEGLPIESRHNPIFDSGKIPGAADSVTLQDIYGLMISLYAQRLTDAVRLIADSGADPVLVHCTAGKDRTGVVIALALLAAGVDREHVIRDYAATEANLAGDWSEMMLAALAKHPGLEAVGENLREIISASPAAVLSTTLNLVEESYGSAEGLLTAHGFSNADLQRLRDVLTVPTVPTAH